MVNQKEVQWEHMTEIRLVLQMEVLLASCLVQQKDVGSEKLMEVNLD